ncbi:MAG: hypothetical protein RR212_00010 [Bacteroidales bacterium]
MIDVEIIIEKLKTRDNLITRLHADEIELSLTCNLSDLRTYNYARNYFPNFYTRMINEYTILVNQLKSAENALLDSAQRSLDLIKLAGVTCLTRLNAEKEKRNE